MATTEDYKKYFCALGSRSIRRVAAKMHAVGLDTEVRSALMKELMQAAMCQRMAAVVGWPLDDDIGDEEDAQDPGVEIDWAVYSDGRPVFTIIDWIDGYATVVHHPDSLKPETPDTGELEEELWPCGHRMTFTESGDDDAPNRAEALLRQPLRQEETRPVVRSYAVSTTNESAAFTRLRDDLLWLYAAQGCSPADGLRAAVDAMIAEYTADSDHYSDGSPIGAEYIPDYAPNVILYEPLPPPHRRTPEASH